ncbi:hypothetical protein C8R44DRAFT_800058 [Mycena epipterygia]|nr:hypothetical protein C8R44DRAFT_800058 [Mycena epipterygia]
MACPRDDSARDLEIIAWPGFATAISMAETGKRYITVAALNHPFSRGIDETRRTHPIGKGGIRNERRHITAHVPCFESHVPRLNWPPQTASTE